MLVFGQWNLEQIVRQVNRAETLLRQLMLGILCFFFCEFWKELVRAGHHFFSGSWDLVHVDLI